MASRHFPACPMDGGTRHGNLESGTRFISWKWLAGPQQWGVVNRTDYSVGTSQNELECLPIGETEEGRATVRAVG